MLEKQIILLSYFRMDVQFRKRKTGKDNERRTRELYGSHSAKRVRIQEQCQENHVKNVQESRLSDSAKGNQQQDKGKSSKNKKGRK